MNNVCEVCADIGFKHLLLCCIDCKRASTHQYCLDKVLYDASLVDWVCDECHQRHTEGSYSRSLGKVSSERSPNHTHFGSTSQQPITNRVESARVFGSWGQRKSKSYTAKSAYMKKINSSEMNSLRKKGIRKKSNMRGMSIKRRGCRDASTACTSGKASHSCESIRAETTENKDGNWQVANENSVQTLKLNNDVGSNHLTPGLKQINHLKQHDERSKCMKEMKIVASTLDNSNESEPSNMNECSVTHEVNSKAGNKPSDELLVHQVEDRRGELTIASPQNTSRGDVHFTHRYPNKQNNCLPSMRIESDNLKKNHSGPSKLLDKDNSCSSLEISSKAIVIKASGTEVEISDTLENFGKVTPRKRRRLILNDDDEVEEKKAEDARNENANPQPPKCDEPMTKHRVNTEYCVEEAARTGELNDQNLMNVTPVKRRRRYIAQNEDEEDILCSANAECALNEATNRSLNDGANLVPQTSVATDHSQQCRPSRSESDDQQYYIYSQALDEPVWSGVFKIDTEVLMLDAHLSTKACQRVRDLSTSLQPVVELNKLPRSQAWPKSWNSFGPTDDNIGLFFFPHSLRQNEVANRLVNNLINSDCALKVTVGIAELLIFPSSLLPEQYHFFQGNHYLWGVFRQKKDMADETVLVKEQYGSVKHAIEQGQQQEQDLLDQQDEALYESSDQETFAVKHVVHIENQLLVEFNHEAKKEVVEAATREGTNSPGRNWSSSKTYSAKVGSNCSVEPRDDSKLDALEDLDQQEGFTPLPESNASSITEQSSNSGHATASTKLIKPVEHGHGQPHSGSEPSTRKLFGFVTAQTPRSQQLIQEMVSEGALVFPVPEIVTNDSITGHSTGVISSGMNPVIERPHLLRDPPQAFDFISMGHGPPGADSEACLDLFPVQREHIGLAPRVQVSREVDLDLNLGKRSQAPSVPPLL